MVPAFRSATKVRGAFGWFSAGWIPQLAKGLVEYLGRDNVEPMRMVVAPALFPEDLEALEAATSARDVAIARFDAEIEKAGGLDASLLSRHAVSSLAWMYANGQLELRIAVPQPGTNYHPKTWEFSDGEDTVCVMGSANATGRAFRAAEHMDVSCSWDRVDTVRSAMKMIDDWWVGRDEDVLVETVTLPEALSRRLVERAPAQPPEAREIAHVTDDQPGGDLKKGWTPMRTVFRIPDDVEWRTGLYSHQGEAVQAWEDSGRRGILEMATGAGKTITALIAAFRAHQEHDGPFLIVISVPTNALVAQWIDECERFGLRPVVPSRHAGGDRKAALANMFARLRGAGRDAVEAIVLTNNMLRRDDFQDMLDKEVERNYGLSALLIGDEVHSLGTEGFLNDATQSFALRLGLSATPDRQYDDEGTRSLKEYFGDSVYEFGLDRAIGFCLVPYDYFVHVVNLDAEEIEEYRRLSAEIGKAAAMDDDDRLKRLLIQRRAVIENANAKPSALVEILGRRRPDFLLVYVSAKNPAQMESVMDVLDRLRIDASRVTQEESGKPEVLASILDGFGRGNIHALVAKKVLDEGVDIPATREAVLVASSTVEREWIQRRGRVLRRFPGKDHAVIHDVIALPSADVFDSSLKTVLESELNRVRAFGRHARNAVDVFSHIEEVLDGYPER